MFDQTEEMGNIDCLDFLRCAYAEKGEYEYESPITEEDEKQVQKLSPLLDLNAFNPAEVLVYNWDGTELEFELDTDFVCGIEVTSDYVILGFFLTSEALEMKKELLYRMCTPKKVDFVFSDVKGNLIIAQGSFTYNGNFKTSFDTGTELNQLLIKFRPHGKVELISTKESN